MFNKENKYIETKMEYLENENIMSGRPVDMLYMLPAFWGN